MYSERMVFSDIEIYYRFIIIIGTKIRQRKFASGCSAVIKEGGPGMAQTTLCSSSGSSLLHSL